MRKHKAISSLINPKPKVVNIVYENGMVYTMSKGKHGWHERNVGLYARSLKQMKRFIKKHQSNWLIKLYK